GKAPPAPGSGQVPLYVEEDGTLDVAGVVGLAAAAGGVEVPAHVHHPQVRIAEVRGEPIGGDERVHGRRAPAPATSASPSWTSAIPPACRRRESARPWPGWGPS